MDFLGANCGGCGGCSLCTFTSDFLFLCDVKFLSLYFSHIVLLLLIQIHFLLCLNHLMKHVQHTQLLLPFSFLFQFFILIIVTTTSSSKLLDESDSYSSSFLDKCFFCFVLQQYFFFKYKDHFLIVIYLLPSFFLISFSQIPF